MVGFQTMSGAVATAIPTYTRRASQNRGARDKFTSKIRTQFGENSRFDNGIRQFLRSGRFHWNIHPSSAMTVGIEAASAARVWRTSDLRMGVEFWI